MKIFRIALILAAASVSAPLAAQNIPEFDPDQTLYARVWNILDADRDRHPVTVYVRDIRLLSDTFDDHDIVITGPDGFESAALFDDVQPIGSLGGDGTALEGIRIPVDDVLGGR